MSLDSDVPGRADAVVTSSVRSLRLIRTRGPEKAGSATTVRPATPKRKNSLAVGPSSYSLPPQASGLVTMKRMVALASPTLNESNVEPSSYAWLRTRAPVPTTYAPACDPLYPFQEILENRTSRARGMTSNCTEVPERKFAICIEIWQVEMEDGVWRVSFHKYAYVHGDPIQGIDPTGKFFALLGGLLVSTSIYSFQRSRSDGAALSVLALIKNAAVFTSAGAATYFGIGGVYVAWFTKEAQWKLGRARPDHDQNSTKQLWVDNIEMVLLERVQRDTAISPGQRAKAVAGARLVAERYVELTQHKGVKEHGLEAAGANNFGKNGANGWIGNWGHPERHCTTWVHSIQQKLDHSAKDTGWVIRGHHNQITAGDLSLFWWTHSYMSITLEPNAGPMASAQEANKIDYVLDPWGTGRPDLYDADEFTARWPMNTWPIDIDPWGP